MTNRRMALPTNKCLCFCMFDSASQFISQMMMKRTCSLVSPEYYRWCQCVRLRVLCVSMCFFLLCEYLVFLGGAGVFGGVWILDFIDVECVMPHTYVHTYTYTHTHAHAHMHTFAYAYKYPYTYTCTHAYTCTHTYAHADTYPDTYTYTYTCSYARIQTQNSTH